MKKVFIPLILMTLLFSACVKNSPTPIEKTVDPLSQELDEKKVITTTPSPAPVDVKSAQANKKSYTMAEVATHKNGLSCWMILDNGVYDVTNFISEHPNDAILKGCGKDATQMFARHPESAKEMKEKFYIGELKQ